MEMIKRAINLKFMKKRVKIPAKPIDCRTPHENELPETENDIAPRNPNPISAPYRRKNCK